MIGGLNDVMIDRLDDRPNGLIDFSDLIYLLDLSELID